MDAHTFKEGKLEQGSGVEVEVEGLTPIEVDFDAGSTVNSESQKKELESVKRRLKEIEEEASNLRAKFEIAEPEQGGQDLAAAALAEKEEADSRSIFVGNVDYDCMPEEVQQHFQSCGTVNRVTIMNDGFGHPKGFAYVEFAETEAVQNALALNDTELHGRPIKVSPKRTNVPGMTPYRGRRFTRRPFTPGPANFPSYAYGYGRFPRFRPSMRHTPY